VSILYAKCQDDIDEGGRLPNVAVQRFGPDRFKKPAKLLLAYYRHQTVVCLPEEVEKTFLLSMWHLQMSLNFALP
jgi:hypothetical protein